MKFRQRNSSNGLVDAYILGYLHNHQRSGKILGRILVGRKLAEAAFPPPHPLEAQWKLTAWQLTAWKAMEASLFKLQEESSHVNTCADSPSQISFDR